RESKLAFRFLCRAEKKQSGTPTCLSNDFQRVYWKESASYCTWLAIPRIKSFRISTFTRSTRFSACRKISPGMNSSPSTALITSSSEVGSSTSKASGSSRRTIPMQNSSSSKT
ncbi:hypothetical protein PMAYCL1PPCAC_11335, partial [Pristionchus mayeri]